MSDDPVAPMALMEQANLIRAQLGYPAELPLSQVIERAEADLGLDTVGIRTVHQVRLVQQHEIRAGKLVLVKLVQRALVVEPLVRRPPAAAPTRRRSSSRAPPT